MEAKDVNLLLRSLDATLGADEEARIQALLQVSHKARKEKKAWISLRDDVRNYGSTSFEHGFADRVMQQLMAGADPQVAPKLPERHTANIFSMTLRIAASVILLVAIGLLAWSLPRTISVPYGETMVEVLPDGSSVELSSGSTIRYVPFTGRSTRTVTLQGEAFFSVKPGQRPFVVKTFNASIEVLGTRFNVRAWPAASSPSTMVAVEEGRVAVMRNTSQSPASSASNRDVLTRSETAVVLADTTMPRRASLGVSAQTVWRKGGFTSRNERFIDVIAELERRFNTSITLPEAFAHRQVGYFKPIPVPLDTMLIDICTPMDLAFRQTADGYEIFVP